MCVAISKLLWARDVLHKGCGEKVAQPVATACLSIGLHPPVRSVSGRCPSAMF